VSHQQGNGSGITAYAFDSYVENGGHGVKIGLYCVQAARRNHSAFHVAGLMMGELDRTGGECQMHQVVIQDVSSRCISHDLSDEGESHPI
jgi:hypothetical protein